MAGHGNSTLEQFRAHDFEADESYQGGLKGMLSSGVLEGKTEDEQKIWLLQTKVFYFNHLRNAALTVEEVLAAMEGSIEDSNTPSNAIPTEESSPIIPEPVDEPRTLSFAELKALIEQGKTDQIPNNKDIPNELSKEPPSESKAAVRKKPWEV